MKKRLLVAVLSVSLLTAVFAGCADRDASGQTDARTAGVEIKQADEGERLESGKVALRV